MKPVLGVALLLLSDSASAAPRIDPLVGDRAVVQRGVPIPLRGDADPGERLIVRFAGAERTVVAGLDGRWSVELDPLPAGGPHRLDVTGGGGTATAGDILVGDVWLCSGQSNMEFPVRRSLNGEVEVAAATDRQIRLLTVPQKTALVPQERFQEAPAWQPATPQSTADFSAACYFMARQLRATQKVPIGLIDASWGGTPIRAWTDEAGVRASGGSADADLVGLYRRQPGEALRRFGATFGAWWRKATGMREPWIDGAGTAWAPVANITDWTSWGPDFADYSGSVLARQTVELTAAEARQPATLSLGVLDEQDTSFVNGVLVGGTNSWTEQRAYPISPGILKAGVNEIIVIVRNSYGPGGFHGPAQEIKLGLADGRDKPLLHGWHYAKLANTIGPPPPAPWDGLLGVSTIYNGMIAPLGRAPVKGVAWYQGEADVGQPGYEARLAAMRATWRRQFGDPQLPFLIVALAGYGKPVSNPVESALAALIDEQRRAAAADPKSALVVATDLGEPDDLHPPNKQGVGRRLALAARRIAYGDGGAPATPLPVAAVRTPRGIEVELSGGIRVIGNGRPVGVELCGSTQGSCRYADAYLASNRLVIPDDRKPASRVRYGWSDFPVLNLYSDELPVPPFELPIP